MSHAKLVIIDIRVEEYNKIISSLREDVAYVLLDYYSDTIETLYNKITALKSPVKWDSVALVSHSVFSETYKILDSMNDAQLSSVSNLDVGLLTWKQFSDFFISLNTQTIDLLGCALYMDENWKYVLNTLESQMSVDFRASVDDTGALAVGGNWVLESDNVNVKDVYFTEEIEGWLHILAKGYLLHSAIIDFSGNLYTTGSNTEGQLGHGNLSSINIFTRVLSISNEIIDQVFTGIRNTACITKEGKLYTWGGNSVGQLGHGDTLSRLIPTLVSDLSNRKIVSAKCGNFTIICLDSSGYVYTAGSQINRDNTQIPSTRFGIMTGNASNIDRSISNEFIVQIDTGGATHGVLTSTNKLYMWGSGLSYKFGNNLTSNIGSIDIPDLEPISSNVKKAILGEINTAFITLENKLIVMGSNSHSHINSGNIDISNRNTYYYDNSGADFCKDISDAVFGYQNFYVIKKNGTTYFSGRNDNGRGGFGNINITGTIQYPTIIPDINIVSIYPKIGASTNQINVSIIDTNYNFKVLGYNGNGQLGTGNYDDVNDTWLTIQPPFNNIKIVKLPDFNNKVPSNLTSFTYSNNFIMVDYGINFQSDKPNINDTGGPVTFDISRTVMFISGETVDISGGYPLGVTIDSSGIISVSSTTRVGDYIMTIRARNSFSSITTTIQLIVNPIPITTFSYSSNSIATYGISGNSVVPTINETGSRVTYGISGPIPSGISIDNSGRIVWNTDVAVALYSLSVFAQNRDMNDNIFSTANTNFTLRINPKPITTFSYTPTDISFNFGVAGQIHPIINGSASNTTGYSIFFGSAATLPTGITINSSSGIISISNTIAVNTYNISIVAQNFNTSDQFISSKSTPVSIKINIAPLTTFSYSINSQTINYGSSGSSTSTATVNSTGTTPTYTITSISPNSSGFSINSSGRIFWTNSIIPNTYTLTITANNTVSTLTTTFTLTVNLVPITSLVYDPSMISVNYGNTYTSNIPTVNGSNYNRVFSLVGAPIGTTIDNSGRFTVPSTLIPTTYNFTIRATNDNINFASFSLRITVNLVPLTSINYSITTVDISYGNTYTSAMPSSIVGSNYNVVYSLSGEPNGVTIDNSGVIRVADYVLIKNDGYNFTVRATNDNINFALRTFTINIKYSGFAYYNNNVPPRLININDSSTYYQGVIGIPSSSGTPVYTLGGGTITYKIRKITRIG